MSEQVYRCPILDEEGLYEQQLSDDEYDPRHYETLPKMIEHLRGDNGWTDKEIADWQESARPEWVS